VFDLAEALWEIGTSEMRLRQALLEQEREGENREADADQTLGSI
jgi:hypothetical protein